MDFQLVDVLLCGPARIDPDQLSRGPKADDRMRD